MVNNSQGHSAYSEDALLTTHMNVNPGGKHAQLWDGWFVPSGESTKVSQLMIYPADHLNFPDQQKSIKNVLLEHGFNIQDLHRRCKKCDPDSETCCCKCLLELQPDFWEQKSLAQEVIEKAGHLSFFLPKFHCELSPIEFFWVQWNGTSVNTVITHLIPWRKMCWKQWPQFHWKQYINGNITCIGGWIHIIVVWRYKRPKNCYLCYLMLQYMCLYNAPSGVSSLGSCLVRLVYPAEDGKISLSLIPSSAVPLCPVWLKGPWILHSDKNMFVHSIQGFTSPTNVFPNKWQGNLIRYFLICNMLPN